MKKAVIIKHPGRDYDWRVDIVDVPEEATFEEVEKAVMRTMLGPFQVVAITSRIDLDRKLELEPPFDWSTVKPGMAFMVKRDDEISFVAHWIGHTRDGSACVQPMGQARPEVYTKDILTRAPAHDIPEAA